MPYKVAVTGCFGRMGREITKALQHYDLGGEFELYCGVYKDDESEVYKPDFKVVPNINDCIKDVDLVVDLLALEALSSSLLPVINMVKQ
jgi:dihydrodipicolinate reductase